MGKRNVVEKLKEGRPESCIHCSFACREEGVYSVSPIARAGDLLAFRSHISHVTPPSSPVSAKFDDFRVAEYRQ